MNVRSLRFAVVPAILTLVVSQGMSQARVRVGADLVLTKYPDLLGGKRVGLVTNRSAIIASGQTTADAFYRHEGIKLVALFAPEHGLLAQAAAGQTMKNGKDTGTGLPVYSLFGTTTKPTAEMLAGVDVLVYDIQDVGARFYTFESTLSLSMESAAEHGIPFIVLDRPNPAGGVSVEGYVRLDSLRSFVGLNPTPITHGMTVGELAGMINGEGWLRKSVKAKLTVVRMEGWKRTMWFDETGLTWVSPSPNMKTPETAVVYPGTCLVEGTNLSEGRGTDRPFEYIGAPFVDGKKLAEDLNARRLPGVRFGSVDFTPRAIPGVVENPKFVNTFCEGVRVVVTDRSEYAPVRTGVHILAAAKKLFGKHFRWDERWIDRLAGTPELRTSIDAGVPPDQIAKEWSKQVGAFERIRSKYLLY